MNKLKFLLSAVSLMFAALIFGQTDAASFTNEAAIWQKTDAGYVSTFTINASEDGLSQIKERYDGLGQNVKYTIKTTESNAHIITMTFTPDISQVYLYKMLLYIGCQTVTVGEKTMSMEEFMSYLM